MQAEVNEKAGVDPPYGVRRIRRGAEMAAAGSASKASSMISCGTIGFIVRVSGRNPTYPVAQIFQATSIPPGPP